MTPEGVRNRCVVFLDWTRPIHSGGSFLLSVTIDLFDTPGGLQVLSLSHR